MSVCLCGCLSVNYTPLCASHLLLFRLFPHTFLSCPPTASDNPRCLSDTSRGLCEHHLSLSHEWFYLHGHGALATRKSTLCKSLILGWMNVSRNDGILAAQACKEDKQRKLLLRLFFAKQGEHWDLETVVEEVLRSIYLSKSSIVQCKNTVKSPALQFYLKST